MRQRWKHRSPQSQYLGSSGPTSRSIGRWVLMQAQASYLIAGPAALLTSSPAARSCALELRRMMPPGLLEGRALLDGDPGLFFGDVGRSPGMAVGSGA